MLSLEFVDYATFNFAVQCLSNSHLFHYEIVLLAQVNVRILGVE